MLTDALPVIDFMIDLEKMVLLLTMEEVLTKQRARITLGATLMVLSVFTNMDMVKMNYLQLKLILENILQSTLNWQNN